MSFRGESWSPVRRRVLVVVLAISSVVPVSVHPQDATSLFKEGFELLRGGNAAGAVQRFEQGLRDKPDDPLANYFLGQAWRSLGRWDKARAQYERAVSLDPQGQAGQDARKQLATLPGSTFRDCDVCPEMVIVPPGSFTMGSPSDERGRDDDEGPQRAVTIGRPLAVGKFEVTAAENWACVEDKACNKDDGTRWERGHPIVNVTWDAAVRYTEWLQDKTGKRYRLLTEAEWEYAARAGSETPRYWGASDDKACQYGDVSNPATKAKYGDKWLKWDVFTCDDGYVETSPPGRFKPNAFGLYDMLGNVWEWVQDCYKDSYQGAPTDGSAVLPASCEQRVLRGGSWASVPRFVRSANRGWYAPSTRDNSVGFRVARTLSAP